MWFAQERVAEVALVVRIGDGVCQRPLTLTRRSADDDDGSSAVIQPLDDELFAVRVVTIDDCRTGACGHGLFLTDVARRNGSIAWTQLGIECPTCHTQRIHTCLRCVEMQQIWCTEVTLRLKSVDGSEYDRARYVNGSRKRRSMDCIQYPLSLQNLNTIQKS